MMIRDESDLRELLTRATPTDPAPVRFAAVAVRAEQLHRRRTRTWSAVGALSFAAVAASAAWSPWWWHGGGQVVSPGSTPAAAVGPTGSIVDPVGAPMSTPGLVTAAAVVLAAVLAVMVMNRFAGVPRVRALPGGAAGHDAWRAMALGAALVGAAAASEAIQLLLVVDAFTGGRSATVDHTTMLVRIGGYGALGSVVSVVLCAVLAGGRPLGLWAPLALQVGAGVAAQSGSLVMIWLVQGSLLELAPWRPLAWVYLTLAAGLATAWVSAHSLLLACAGAGGGVGRSLRRSLMSTIGVVGVWAAMTEVVHLWSLVGQGRDLAAVQRYFEAGPFRVVLVVGVVVAILSAVGGGLGPAHPTFTRSGDHGASGPPVRRVAFWQISALGSAPAAAWCLVLAILGWQPSSSLRWTIVAFACWLVCAVSVWLVGVVGVGRPRSP